MKNKKLLSLVVSALTLASVVGCGGGKGGENVITIWVGAESVQFYSQKVEEYKDYYAQQKGEKFPCTFSVKGVDTGTAADVWLSDPEVGADIFTIAHDNIAKLVDGDCPIMPVTDQSLLAQVNDMNPASFLDVIKGTYREQQYTFAIPYISQALVLFYNKQYVTAEQAKSWEGLKEAAEAASASVGKVVQAGSFLGTDGYNFSWPVLARKASDNSTTVKIYEGGEQQNCYFQGDDTVSVMKWTQDFFKSENGAKFPTSDGWEVELQNTISLSVIGGAWSYQAAKAALGSNLAITTLPTFTITENSAYGDITAGTKFQSGTFVDCKAFVMKRESKCAAYLQDVVKYLTTVEMQEESFETCQNLPAYKNAATEFDAMKGESLEAQLASAQVAMSEFGIAQPFGYKAKFNTYYYSKGAPEKIKAAIENVDGSYSTFDAIKAECQNVEHIWRKGKEISAA